MGYAGMMLGLTGAALSRFAIGDNKQTIIISLVIAIVVTINYALRHSMAEKIVSINLIF